MTNLHTYNPNVLVLEDNEFQRLAAVSALRSIGVTRITQASSAEQVLTHLQDCACRFDAIICDLRLQAMDGLEFLMTAPLDRLGSIVLTSALPADIYLTSLRILRESGARVVGCLPKPIDAISLKQMLLDPPSATTQNRHSALSALMEMRQVSRKAIERGLQNHEFTAYFQPKINLQTNQFCGAEALVRWCDPQAGTLQPGQFLDQVQAYGLIDELTCEVMTQVCDVIASWPRDIPKPQLSVNISASSLQDNTNVSRWRDIFDRRWVPASQITLELTESTFFADDLALQEGLTRLRIAGFGVSLDDFGTGFTSLRQLRTLPITELKIDRSFIHDASTQSRPAIILDSIISVASRLRIATVAEGIESQADATYLADLGCQVGQGYFFARPLPAEALIKWIRDWNKRHKNLKE